MLKPTTKRVGLLLISFIFALVLFLQANTSNFKNAGPQMSRVTETYTHTVEEVPIEFKYDEDKYFISGYTAAVDVYLTSTNRVKLDSEINSDTRKFSLVVDLSAVTEGTSRVPIEVRNLPSEMTASVSPATTTVTVGKKKTKTFTVKPDLGMIRLADGYEASSIKLSKTEVTVTSDETTLDLIDYIGAGLPENQVLSEDYEGELTLQAYSKDGKVLSSIIDPPTVAVKIKVRELSKTVPVKVAFVGELPETLSDISYELDVSKITLKGSSAALEAIDEVTLTIDRSEITEDTTQSYTLNLGGLVASPRTIKVNLITTKK